MPIIENAPRLVGANIIRLSARPAEAGPIDVKPDHNLHVARFIFDI